MTNTQSAERLASHCENDHVESQTNIREPKDIEIRVKNATNL